MADQNTPQLSPVSQLAVSVAVQLLQSVKSFKSCDKIPESYTAGVYLSACKMQTRRSYFWV